MFSRFLCLKTSQLPGETAPAAALSSAERKPGVPDSQCCLAVRGSLISHSDFIITSPLIFQDAILQNRELWLLIKKEFGFYSKSQYRILQRKLAEDSTWPPVNRTDYADDGKNGFYINRAYESPEQVPKGRLRLGGQAAEQHFWTRL